MMVKHLPLLLMLLLTGCNTLVGGRATPTPVMEDRAIQRFLTRAPAPIRINATPTPADTTPFHLPPGVPLPLVDPLTVVGDLTVSGSPTLGLLTRLLYANFVSDGYRDTARIDEISTDAAFALYCTQAATAADAIDMVMADRPITQSELEQCRQQQRQPVALRVAMSAVVIVAPADAKALDSISRRELAALFIGRRWSDVRSTWPAADIVRIVPMRESRPFALFADKILGRTAVVWQTLPATTWLDDGQEIAFTIADTPNAIGFLNFVDYQQAPTGLRILALDGIMPNEQTVSSGAYPLTYTLLLYTDAATLTRKAQVGAFLLYYLANMNEALATVGNFPVDEAGYERAKAILLMALGQEAYLAQFPPTSTPAPPTATPTVTPTAVLSATVTR